MGDHEPTPYCRSSRGPDLTCEVHGGALLYPSPAIAFETKDSGRREQFDSGMVRDVTEGKIDYTFVLQGPMLDRWAQLMERGAVKYDRDNWMKANGYEELARFEQSALRHMIQYLRGDRSEDHAAAVIFNLNGAEYVREKLADA